MKIRPVEAQWFHAETRTGKHVKANSLLSQIWESTQQETEEISK
jgi:hypothetical protein